MKVKHCSMWSAFTLVEVLIVIMIIGILAAVTVPQFTDAAQESRLNTTAMIVRSVQRAINEKQVRTGRWPTTIEASWFEGQQLPEHPDNKVDAPAIEVVAEEGVDHPTNKVLKEGVGGAFWYNSANGFFRGRVIDQGDEASTLEAYNQVNQSTSTDLGNYSEAPKWS